MADVISQRGYEVLELPAPPLVAASAIADGDYAAWLGVSESVDAAETIAVLGDAVDRVVVDHYSLGSAWESSVRQATGGIIVIDDLAREHACEMIIDQNYFPAPELRYDGRVPADAVRLCGPRYALLAQEFGTARTFLRPRRGPVARILVYYGGADLSGETARALRVLSGSRFTHLGVDVVVSKGSPHGEEVEELVRRRPRTNLYGPRRSILDLMIEADLMIGAGGSTTWERCATGLPAIVTVIGENQRGYNEALAKDGLIAYLGTTETVNDSDLASTLESLLRDDSALARMSLAAWEVTDASGARCVAEAILPTSPDQWELLRHPDAAADARRWRVVTPAGLEIGHAALAADGLVKVTMSAGDASASRTQVLELVAAECERAGISATLTLDASRSAGMLALTILSDRGSWIKGWTPRLAAAWLEAGHSVRLISRVSDLKDGDICFLLSVGQVLMPHALRLHRHNLVVHAADLPRGRGWSPMTWQVLEGRGEIVVSLLEAGEKVDSGRIYNQKRFNLMGGELLDELQVHVANATVALCTAFVNDFPASGGKFREQSGEPTYYRRRTPSDSAFDPSRPLADQFDLLRVADPERYPAYFSLRGREYTIHVREKAKQAEK